MALAAPGRSRTARQLEPALASIFVISLACGACQQQAAGTNVDLLLPEGVGTHVELLPRVAFAEYVELPELRRELRITLASYDLSCDRYLPPGPSDTLFVFTLSNPPNEPFAPGTIAFAGAPASDAGALPRATAFAVARQGEHGYEFPNGGSIELRQVELTASGHVSGVLGLEFPGDGTRPAAGAHGKFDARMCRGD